MLKRVFSVALLLNLLFSYLPVNARANDIIVSAESAIVMIADTGQVVYEKNAYEKRGMASTTKIMSSIVALENGDLNSSVEVSYEDVSVEGTSLGLKAGDTVDLLSLVKGMLISSGNDSANVTATLVGSDRANFVRMMNDKARELGMKSTQFKNPSGLTEEGHYSTAYDMAVLGSYAIKNKIFLSICSSESCIVSFGDPVTERTIYNHNKFLQMFDGALGVKTGYTKASGRCLVTAAERNGVTLVAVTLNAPDDWNDHTAMLEYAFGQVKVFSPDIDCPEVRVVGSEKRFIKTCTTEKIIVPYCGELPRYSVDFYAYPFMYADVYINDYVGYMTITFSGGRSVTEPLVSAENAQAHLPVNTEKSIMEEFKEFLRKGLS